jgi:hypothetical protein
MFILASRRLRGLNGLLVLALLSQLLSGSPIQVLELWCLEQPQACYRIVVRRRSRPLGGASAFYKGAWLMRWLVNTWPRWLPRCGLLLALLVWKRTVCPPLAWGLLAGPLLEVFCLGLGFLCHTACWRRRWWRLARGLNRSYGWAVWMLLLAFPLRQAQDTASVGNRSLGLMAGLLVPSRQGRAAAPQPAVEATEQTSLCWSVPCCVACAGAAGTGVEAEEASPAGEVLFSGWAPDVGAIEIVREAETLRFWAGGLVVFKLPRSDRTALRCLVQLWIRQGWLSLSEAAQVLECSVRTVERDQAAYRQDRDSACLVDRRRFNLGQRLAYRLAEHVAELINQWVLNLLYDEPNNGRHLEEQLAGLFDDRTIDRALLRLGLSAAEAAGVRQKVRGVVEQMCQAAYWAGVEGRPLAEVPSLLPEAGWEQQASDRATLSLATLHLVANGAYAAAHSLQGIYSIICGVNFPEKQYRHRIYLIAYVSIRFLGIVRFLRQLYTAIY